MSTETVRTVRDGRPRTATLTFTQHLSFVSDSSVQCCFMSTETVRTVRDGRPRTATLTFTQHLSFVSDVSVQFSVALRPQRLGWGAMDSHLDFHTACSSSKVKQLFTTMHKCSNLNELLQKTLWTEGLFTGPPPVNMPICFTGPPPVNTPLCFTLYSVPREEIL